MYRSSFVVASAVIAVLSLSYVEQAWTAPITVQSYVYSPGNNPVSNTNTNSAYQDNGATPGTGFSNTELTDGLYPTIGVGTTFTDNRWVGVQNTVDDFAPQPEITFDFGSKFNLNNFTVIYDVDNGPAIHAPDSVSVSYSDDNVIYSAPVSLTGFDNTGSTITRSTTFSFPTNALGQFARLAFYNDQEWTFLAEVSFDGEPFVPAPEPSAFLLLSLGALGLVRKTRRRNGSA